MKKILIIDNKKNRLPRWAELYQNIILRHQNTAYIHAIHTMTASVNSDI